MEINTLKENYIFLVYATALDRGALGTEAASPQHRKGYSQGPDRRRRERPKK